MAASSPPASSPDTARLRRRIRACLLFFVTGLVLSGATAIPLTFELRAGVATLEAVGGASWATHLHAWLVRVRDALVETGARHPFLAYGTDWLAFGHFAIAIAFIGPLRDPVRNRWVVHFGMIACVLVVPYALVMGPLRGIPLYWRLIDASFGVLGLVPLVAADRAVARLAAAARD